MNEQLKNKTIEQFGGVYLKAITFSKKAEGGFSNYESDSGGMTYSGVSRKWNSTWSGWKIIDELIKSKYPQLAKPYTKKPSEVFDIDSELGSNDELQFNIIELYYSKYFKKFMGEEVRFISSNICCILFDISILQGVKRSVKTLQRCLNRNYGCSLVVDGFMGDNTLNALTASIRSYSEKAVVESMLLEYVDNLIQASEFGTNIKFLKGWQNRVMKLRNYLRVS